MAVTINGTTGITTPEVALDNSAADGGQVVLKSSGYGTWNLDNYSGRLRGYYNSTEYFTVDASGNVGIGVTPSANQGKLQANGAGQSWFKFYDSTAGWNFGTFYKANGTSALAYLGGGGGSAIAGGSVDDFVVRAEGNLLLAIGSTERARIDSSGNLLVGTTNAAENAGAGMKVLNTGGTVALVSTASTGSQQGFEMYSSTAAAYRLYIDYAGVIHATNTTISAISDIRYKENIRDLDVGLDKIMALKPRLYDWKEGKGADIKNARGFIAQEFETVFPDLIDEWLDPAPEGEEPYKSVRADLIPVLVKAIQEQQALIQQLQADVAALKGQP